MLDFLITGGRVIDPSTGRDAVADVGIRAGRIALPQAGEGAAHMVDAAGCLVTPGLIDAHAHAYRGGSGLGVQPDLLLSTGVTSQVDAGTAGWANYEAFHNTVAVNSLSRIFSLVGYNASGQVDLGYLEDYSRDKIKPERIRRLLEQYPGEVLGLKMRFQKEVVGSQGLHHLEELLTVAEELGCPVVVHTTDPPVHGGTIASMLRPGDVYCHCYQGKGLTILDEEGALRPQVLAARARGVLFDAANGTGNFAFSVAKAALKQGFKPDLIGADNALNSFGLENYAANLPFVLSKYLHLGMTLTEVLSCVTVNAARFLGRGDLGTLAPGAMADVAVFRLAEKKTRFWDSVKTAETEEYGEQMLIPLMTWLGGQVVYRSNEL